MMVSGAGAIIIIISRARGTFFIGAVALFIGARIARFCIIAPLIILAPLPAGGAALVDMPITAVLLFPASWPVNKPCLNTITRSRCQNRVTSSGLVTSLGTPESIAQLTFGGLA